MEIEQVRNKLYKDNGEFSILYDELVKINDDFELLLSIKEAKSKENVKETMIATIKKANKDVTDQEIHGVSQLVDSLIWIIFKDIKECHKQIYG